MGKRDSKEVVKSLRESVELIQKCLAERRNEKGKDNPGNFEEMLLNGVMKANGALAILVERTEAIDLISKDVALLVERMKVMGSISKAVWIMTAETSIIFTIMLSLIFKLLII
ncbi:MAG: hypothetical protein QXU12_04105 [Nitrososphaerota archaeon]